MALAKTLRKSTTRPRRTPQPLRLRECRRGATTSARLMALVDDTFDMSPGEKRLQAWKSGGADTGLPLTANMSVLGMTGMTAYFALLDVGAPKAGETVVISGAAGAVGSVAGQIAKLKGCRVVGIAGGADKCKFLVDELGFDGAIDYKNEDVIAGLKRECPKGVDVYFDNVGGDILDAVLTRLAFKARVVICGAISQYNNKQAVKGPANYLNLLVNSARMEGMVVMTYAPRFAEAAAEMGGWMASGKLKSKEDIVSDLTTFPETLLKLFSGENFGKLVLKVD